MAIWNSLGELRGRPAALRSLRRPGQADRACRPALEALEDRCLLSYAITDLGTLGAPLSEAYGINASGQVAGYSVTADGHDHAFLYDATVAPPMQDLGTLGGRGSYARGINASGQVVGHSYTTTDNVEHAFLYDATATPAMQDLGTLGGALSDAYGINASGQVVGQAQTSDGATHAFLYDPTVTPAMQDLGTLDGGPLSDAFGVNDSGQVVGHSFTAGWAADHAFLYDPTATPAMQDLGTLGGPQSIAYGINASGQVVGFASTAANADHAFLYDPNATPAMQDLGTLGGPFSVAYGINASGQVVGLSETASGVAGGAFLYDGTAMQNLNDLIPPGSGWVLGEATAINDNGQIAGFGQINGHLHAFLLTPGAGPGAAPAAHQPPAARAPRSATANPSFLAPGGSALAADTTLASAAARGSVLPPALTAQTVPGREADVASALADDGTVTREQSASPIPGTHHAPDGLDLFFADLGQDLRLDGRLA
jgi:probable HAF family extracellular repeat protein